MEPAANILDYHRTPVHEVHDQLLDLAGVRLLIKREDLNHPTVSGNKWWKLKYNLKEALEQNHHTLLTFGGSFSNHIYATAAAAGKLGLQSIGVIRGEETLPLNPVLSFASSEGMELHYVPRLEYKFIKDQSAILKERYGDFYLIPEGGSNELAVVGVAELVAQLDLNFDYLCCPVGTGATLAGLIRGFAGNKSILGFCVLKGGDSWLNEIEKFNPGYSNWQLIHDYHSGGYAKAGPALHDFIKTFTLQHHVPLEHVYSAKLFMGIYDLAQKGYFRKGSTIMALHTGGIHRALRSDYY